MKTLIRGYIGTKNNSFVSLGVNNGIIEEVAEGELEEYEDAELQIGGKDRIIIPAKISLSSIPFLYPFRHKVNYGKMKIGDVISIITPKDTYLFSMIAAYSMALDGISTSVVTGIHIDSVMRGFKEVGIRAIPAIPVECPYFENDWEKEAKIIKDRWSSLDTPVLLRVCSQENLKEIIEEAIANNYKVLLDKTVELNIPVNEKVKLIALGGGVRKDLNIIRRMGGRIAITPSQEIYQFSFDEYEPGLALENSSAFNLTFEMQVAISRLLLSPENAIKASYEWGFSSLGLSAGAIKKKSIADIVVLECSKPPCAPIDKDSIIEQSIFGGNAIETVIVGGNVIVDGGEALYIGSKIIQEARSRLEELEKKVTTK